MGNFVFNQQLGDGHLSLSDLKKQIETGDHSTAKKNLYFCSALRGSSQYWAQRGKELRSLIQFKINEGSGLPSFFTTGSCAEFHFPSLKRLLALYVKEAHGLSIDLNNRQTLFQVLQENTHVVAHYFDLRTTSYFRDVMKPVFGVDTFWYRQEFAKSRGMVHWHGLCWRGDKEPHTLLYEALKAGLTDDQCAEKLSLWASSEYKMSASHPAGQNESGEPNRQLWPPPEGTAPAPPDENNPLDKMLMDVSLTQETLLEDFLLLSNRFNLHRCSDSYCLKQTMREKKKVCRMEFPKTIRPHPAIILDKNKSLRLEMARDHPVLVQNSRFHTQGWRANGDISLILSTNGPENPPVKDIIATEKYITGYACKGIQPTGAIADLFNDMVNCANETSGTTVKSLCMKLLIGTVKRDVSAVEVSYELSSLPLYRCSHSFQYLSLSGARLFKPDDETLTQNTPLDTYLSRDESNKDSLYSFFCKRGKVPVLSGSYQASWPLNMDFCRTALLLHFPNWRTISKLKDSETSWTDAFVQFLNTDSCPSFVKADVERAKQDHRQDEGEAVDNAEENADTEQPEWMELIRPNPDFDVACSDDFSGVTLHSFLKVPIQQRGKDMKHPEGARGEALQSNCNGVQVLLVDERSLIGATTLGWMEFMCRCGMNAGAKSDQSWGGLPVIVFFGDDVQLPSVLDSPVYICKASSPAALHGVLVWQEFDTAVHLKNIIRQGNEELEFRNVLTALRQYETTPNQAQWLQKFQWNNLRVRYGGELLSKMSDDGLFVFPTHREEWQHNKTKLLEANNHSPITKCTARNQGPHSKSGDSNSAGGLLDTPFLCKNAKVMLTVNLCVPYGLFNGAIGKVIDIIYLDGRKPQDSLPDVVMVEFDSYHGPPYVNSNGKLVPIIPVARPVDCRCFSCKRVQIPLGLGWATTIHRCQGMTIGGGETNKYIVINPGTGCFESRIPGALFVALSRAKSSGAKPGSFPDFAWHPSVLINEDRVCHKVNTPTTRARTKEIHRIEDIVQKTKNTFLNLQNDIHQVLSREMEE